MKIVFIIGSTNSGKTTLIKKLCEDTCFNPVMIGQELRKLYPPSFFEGQAAPSKTDNLAFDIMRKKIMESLDNNQIPLIDGQPRNNVQYELCKEYFENHDCRFINLWASREQRIVRSKNRDKNNEEKLKLSIARIDNDSIILYDIISRLLIDNYNVRSFDTNGEYVFRIKDYILS